MPVEEGVQWNQEERLFPQIEHEKSQPMQAPKTINRNKAWPINVSVLITFIE